MRFMTFVNEIYILMVLLMCAKKVEVVAIVSRKCSI